MDEKTENICGRCSKTFVTKYTLKKHIDSHICDQKNQVQKVKKTKDDHTCISKRCQYKTPSNSDMQKHLKTCKYIETDNIILQIIHESDYKMNEFKIQYEKQIEQLRQDYEKQIEQLRVDVDQSKEMLQFQKECMEKEQERMASLLEKALTKPNITTNTTTNIKGNHNNLQNILASPELYEKQVDPDRIKAIDHSIIEKHFWLGQKGIARFCVDHIVKTSEQDGSKLLLCCTDPSRKRFKYIDATNQIVEDMEARHFINLVSVPIKTVCRDVFDNIVRKIEEDKKDTTDAFDLDLLENKTNIAQQKLLEINDMGDHTRNSEYKTEMSILLNK
jgi:hypothetical protein